MIRDKHFNEDDWMAEPLKSIHSSILEKIIDFYEHHDYKGDIRVNEACIQSEWDDKFWTEIKDAKPGMMMLSKVIWTASFLHMDYFLHCGAQFLAKTLRGKECFI